MYDTGWRQGLLVIEGWLEGSDFEKAISIYNSNTSFSSLHVSLLHCTWYYDFLRFTLTVER